MAEETRRDDRFHSHDRQLQLRRDYERADTRWESASQARDWIILVAIAVLHATWMLLVFAFEPGIR